MIVEGNHDHARAIAKEAGYCFNPERDQVIANAKDGKLLGGVIFTDYNVASIGAHVGSFDPHWLSRDMLWIMFDYPFVQLKVNKIIVQVPARNLQALEFDYKLGFKTEARIADVFVDGDLLVLSMRREDCRWLRLKPRGAPSGKI